MNSETTGDVTVGIFPSSPSDPFYSNDTSAYQNKGPLTLGRYITVVLPGNPTTGYSWAQTGGDPAILQPVGGAAYTPASAGMVGSGGQYAFKFHGIAAGTAKLKFAYRRAWETDVPPLKTYEAIVKVE